MCPLPLGIIASIDISRPLAFSQYSLPAALTYTAAAYAPLSGGKYFAFGANNTNYSTAVSTYYYSNDGITWNAGTYPSAMTPRAAAGNNSSVVLMGNNASTFYTTNGTTWTSFETGTSSIRVEGIWDGTRYIFVDNLGVLLVSSIGTSGTWTSFQTGTGSSAIGFDGVSTYISTSGATFSFNIVRNNTDITDSNAWSTVSLPSTGYWTSIKHNGSIWVAARAGSTAYATSTNGLTWTARTLTGAMSSSTTSGIRPKMGIFKNKFYYSTQGGVVYESQDGINWTQKASFSWPEGSVLALGWAAGPDRILFVGLRSSTGGVSSYGIGVEQ